MNLAITEACLGLDVKHVTGDNQQVITQHFLEFLKSYRIYIVDWQPDWQYPPRIDDFDWQYFHSIRQTLFVPQASIVEPSDLSCP